jgi:hypothetical protein
MHEIYISKTGTASDFWNRVWNFNQSFGFFSYENPHMKTDLLFIYYLESRGQNP